MSFILPVEACCVTRHNLFIVNVLGDDVYTAHWFESCFFFFFLLINGMAYNVLWWRESPLFSIHFLFTRTNDMYFTKIAANYNTTTESNMVSNSKKYYKYYKCLQCHRVHKHKKVRYTPLFYFTYTSNSNKTL